MLTTQQNPVVYMVLKRLRAPLILLILAWSIAILGLSLIPGVEVDGESRHLTIFESFYFVSYMATTIGFGEIHFGFTNPQRLWVTFSIYLTVISWLVAVGKIIALLQDPALKRVWMRQRFFKQVQAINEKFFIICGYGETGELLLHNLSEKGYQCVVIDNDSERVNLLDLDSSVYQVPFLHADASDVESLKLAGLELDNCRAVVAMTSNDQINVKIAVAAKLLRTGVKVICRVHSKEAQMNAKSFDTDHVINPDRLYAESVSLAFRKPSIQQLVTSLMRRRGNKYTRQLKLPKGHWVVCGNTQYSQEMRRFLDYEGMDFTLVDDDPTLSLPHVEGKGTEAVTLRLADIDKSVGIIAGTADDTNNFSVIITARQLNHDLYLMAKQNQDNNRHIFKNADIDSIMESARQLVWQIVPLITQPYLARFLRLVRHQEETWGQQVMTQLKEMSETVPETYLLRINEKKSPAVSDYLASGNILRLQEIYHNGDDAQTKTAVLPLMLVRDGKEELLPKPTLPLKHGDVYLLASSKMLREQIYYTIHHEQDFYYRIHGEEKPVSIVIELIKRRIKDYKKHRRKIRAIKKESAKEKLLDNIVNKAQNESDNHS